MARHLCVRDTEMPPETQGHYPSLYVNFIQNIKFSLSQQEKKDTHPHTKATIISVQC